MSSIKWCTLILLITDPLIFAQYQLGLKNNVPGKSLGRLRNAETFEYEGHRYLFHLEPRTWEDAIDVCHKEGAYLAVLEDLHEVNFVSHAMSGHLCTKTVFQNIWIGGRFFPDTEQWLWDATGYEISEKQDKNNYPPWHMTHEPGLDCLNLEHSLENKPQFVNVDCDRKRRFLCERGCPKLLNTDRGSWNPVGCLLDPPAPGDICKLSCNPGLELFGANPINCAAYGWNNSIGINVIPDCKRPQDISDAIVEQLNVALDDHNSMLIFILDQEVELETFELEKKLTAHLIQMFPVAATQSSFVINGGEVVISAHSDKALCLILKEISEIEYNREKKTNRDQALHEVQKLASSHVDRIPIIVLLSGSNSVNRDGLKAASDIKQESGIILTIGFDDFNAEELIYMSSASWDGLLYYSVTAPESFEKICLRLQQVSDFDNSLCDNHSDAIDIFVEKFNKSLSANNNLLFLLNQSTFWSHEIIYFVLNFIQSLTLASPFSEKQQGGLITGFPAPNVAIPFKHEDTCAFNRHVAKFGNGSEISRSSFLDLAVLARLEAKRVNATGKTVVVVISECNNHSLENDLRLFLGNVFVVKLNTTCWGRTNLDLSSQDKRDQAIAHLTAMPHNDCMTICPGLISDERGFWDHESCSLPGRLGQKCLFTCNEKYELIGSKLMICTEFGWTGSAGDDVLPHCKTPEEIADEFVNKLTGILGNNVDSNFLFVLDESGSVLLENFKTEIEFVDAVVDAFPLSDHRVAGLITFSNQVRNLISLRTSDTCRFIRHTKRINYLGGGTDIHKALVKATSVIQKRAVHPQTLVFLITDGISQTDPALAAKLLKDKGVVLFIIGVAGYKQEQLEPLASHGPDGSANFYGVKSFDVFNQISKYLNQTYHAEGVHCNN